MDYCNSLLIGLPMVRLTALQSVLNAAARLITRLPKFSHISSYMSEHLHWLPLVARIQFKVVALVLKSQLGLSPKYLKDLIRCPRSALSLRPLRSADRFDLFVQRVRTAIAQSRSFASIGPSLWNSLPPRLRSLLLTGSVSSSLSYLKIHFFSRGLCTGSASEGLMLWEALYKLFNTIQYNMRVDCYCLSTCSCYCDLNNFSCTSKDVCWFLQSWN